MGVLHSSCPLPSERASGVRGWANGRRHGNQITSPSPSHSVSQSRRAKAWEDQTERTRRPSGTFKEDGGGRRLIYGMRKNASKKFSLTRLCARTVTTLMALTPASNVVRSNSPLGGGSTCPRILQHCQLVSARIYRICFIFSKGQSPSPGVCQICCLCPGLRMASKPPW